MAVVTVLATVILAIIWYKRTVSSSSRPSLPPGPHSLPIFGYLPFLDPANMHKQFTSMALKYGPIFKLRVGSKLLIIISSLDLVKEVVRDQDEIFANRELTVAAKVITYGGRDIAFSNGSYSRLLRKVFVQDVLNVKNLNESSSYRRVEVRRTIKNIYNDNIGMPVNIKDIASSTVVNTVTNMVFDNTSVQGEKDGYLGAEFQILITKILEILGRPNVSDSFPILAWFDFQGIERGMKKQYEKLDQLITSIIDDRRQFNSKKLDNGVADQEKKGLLQIFLDLMDQKKLNLIQVKGIILDFMTGGTDSITTIVEWVMAEIMNNSNIMKRVQEELAEVVGVNNIVEESHLPKLQYLDATMKETFRLHTLGPLLIPRSPSCDCIVGGYTIPKGCTVMLNAWAIHMDPRYWDNPQEFNPQRFLSSDGTSKYDLKGINLKFVPFGSGRRMCPGVPLADKIQMYIVASLLHSFNWRLPDGEKHDLSAEFNINLRKQKPLIAIPTQRLPSGSLYM